MKDTMRDETRNPTLWRDVRFWLTLGALWTTLAPVVYGLLFERHSFAWGMLWGALLLGGLLYWLGRLHPALYTLLAFGVAFLNAAYTHVAHYWRIGDLAVRIETMLDSSPGEAGEFLQRFVLKARFAWFLLGYVVIAVALGALAWYWWRRARPRAIAWPRWGGLLLALAALIGLTYAWIFPYPAVRWGVTFYQVYTRANPILERKDRITALIPQLPPLACDAPFDKILFVLGESANRDFMSAYGFPEPTTPFLDGLAGKVALRAIAPVNQTMTAVPLILTPATIEDYDRFYTEPSVLTDLRRCGYQVFWFSNQLRYSPYTSSVSSIAAEADEVHFVMEDLKQYNVPDGVLLDLFTPDYIVPGRKQAFFVHLLGSHFEYAKRYPPEAAFYPQPTNLVEHYINTIYYTDQVLARLFEQVHARSENLLFIYVSDHAEWVTPEQSGHASFNPFQDEYRVPLVFWADDPTALQPLARAADDRLVNTEALDRQIHFLLGLEPEPGFSFNRTVLSLGPSGAHWDYPSLPAVGRPEP